MRVHASAVYIASGHGTPAPAAAAAISCAVASSRVRAAGWSLKARGVNPWSASFTIALMHAQHLFQAWLQMFTDSLLISTKMVVPMEPTAAYTGDEPQALTIRHVAEQTSVIVAVVYA